jgi:hypothetical protein
MAPMETAERGAKSRAIREYLSAHPKSGPQQIVDGLKEQGIEVSFGLASAVKYRKKNKGARAGKSARRTVASDKPVSRSELIRRYIASHPDEKPKAIEHGLKQKGIKVSLALIGRVKYAKGAKPRPGRRPRSHVVRVAARAIPSMAVTFEQLLEVKRLADSLGGADQVRQALDNLDLLR